MSQELPVWCELICDSCSRQLAGRWANGEYIPRDALKAEAVSAGAVFKDGDVYCKQCAKKDDKP